MTCGGQMNEKSKEEILQSLEVYSLEGEDYMERLGRLTDDVLSLDHPEEALPQMFGILERYPDEELGSPGPLVHAIEKCRGYEEFLFDSLERQPGTLTVWMLHRLWLKDPKKIYIEMLEKVIVHPRASDLIKEDVDVILSWSMRK